MHDGPIRKALRRQAIELIVSVPDQPLRVVIGQVWTRRYRKAISAVVAELFDHGRSVQARSFARNELTEGVEALHQTITSDLLLDDAVLAHHSKPERRGRTVSFVVGRLFPARAMIIAKYSEVVVGPGLHNLVRVNPGAQLSKAVVVANLRGVPASVRQGNREHTTGIERRTHAPQIATRIQFIHLVHVPEAISAEGRLNLCSRVASSSRRSVELAVGVVAEVRVAGSAFSGARCRAAIATRLIRYILRSEQADLPVIDFLWCRIERIVHVIRRRRADNGRWRGRA